LLLWLCSRRPPPRPRFGLAISGGSALGLAHIGVLQWLDEHRIPVDFIAGTSMGALIGGLYATGHDPREIHQFAASYDQLASFDELPTPFRCVATDLKQGREVVFSQGPLTLALRASMSLPALFAPVEMNGMMLVDGGLLNNLPVDVVQSMGAEIVIAVALDRPPDEQ